MNTKQAEEIRLIQSRLRTARAQVMQTAGEHIVWFNDEGSAKTPDTPFCLTDDAPIEAHQHYQIYAAIGAELYAAWKDAK